MAVACLEGVPGKRDVCESDDLAVALPNLEVFEEHHRWGWLEGLPLELPPHHYLQYDSDCMNNNDGNRTRSSMIMIMIATLIGSSGKDGDGDNTADDDLMNAGRVLSFLSNLCHRVCLFGLLVQHELGHCR